MQYLTPLENLEKKVAYGQKIIIGLVLLLALSIGYVPTVVKKSNPLLIRTETGIVLSEVEPWKLTSARIEEFTRAYLSSRFEWRDETFAQKRKSLSQIADPQVFLKLKDSLQAFEAIAHNQKARSYYILENFQFSNQEQKIMVDVTRVLRIQSAALSTPLRIEINYGEASLSGENPYGLVATSINEMEVTSQ
jgi:hypothetical protein